MTGDREIREMRRNGLKPSHVWVSDFKDAMLDGLTVCVAGDTPEMLDLRFLVGVTVLADSSDPARLKRIASSCEKHATRVIATLSDGRNVLAISDTQGVMTWPE